MSMCSVAKIMEGTEIMQDISDDTIDYNEEWLYCLRANELDEAVQLLNERLVTNLDVVDENGNCALHYCCANNLDEAVIFLLKECKMDYCRVNKNGNTPLQWAVQTNSLEAVKQVLLHDYQVHREEYVSLADSKYYSSMASVGTSSKYKLDDATKLHYNIMEYRRGYIEENRISLLVPNAFKKTILNDAFNAKDQNILQAVLEHPTAAVLDREQSDETDLPLERVTVNGVSGVIHAFNFRGIGSLDSESPQIIARELEIKEDEILNSQCAEMDRSGLVIWETDLVASQWLTALAKDGKFHSKKILQLGSGCGLSSIAMSVAALMFNKAPTTVILSDVSAETLDNLKFNIELNQSKLHGLLQVHKLDWTDEGTWPRGLDGTLEAFDIIVGSDLVYENSLVRPLTHVIDRLSSSKSGEFLYVYKEERQGSQLVPEALQNLGFDVKIQRPPEEFLVNPLTSKDDRTLELFFPELGTEGFAMLQARRS